MQIKNWLYPLILFLSLTISGCLESRKLLKAPSPKFDTELDCPRNRYRIILLESTPDDLRHAIEVAKADKDEFHTHENYTLLKLKSGKSFFIQGISPHQMQYCYLTAIPVPDRKEEYY